MGGSQRWPLSLGREKLSADGRDQKQLHPLQMQGTAHTFKREMKWSLGWKEKLPADRLLLEPELFHTLSADFGSATKRVKFLSKLMKMMMVTIITVALANETGECHFGILHLVSYLIFPLSKSLKGRFP